MSTNGKEVAILGSGVGGITTAILLKRQLGYTGFTIFEQADDLGGTWRDNTYPGCGSDVTGHWYSLSTDLNPNWTSYFPLRPEIHAYWQDLVKKYNLGPSIVYNTRVEGLVWSDNDQAYTLTLIDTKTGAKRYETYRVVVSSLGLFRGGVWPTDIGGKEDFESNGGYVWHSASWRHDVPLTGKRIAVVGNGCSACQLVPELAKDPSIQVVNFCRTPQWFMPRPDIKYPSLVKWIFANVPGVLRIYRNFIYAKSDINFLGFYKWSWPIRAIVRMEMTNYMKKTAPKEYHEKLVPSYPPGCRRIILDPDYLACFHRPNASMNWDGVDTLVPGGVKTKKGEVIPADVVVFATGHETEEYQLDLTGQNGMNLREYFKSRGGPEAYLGTSVPGFPNFFMLMGPNTATGHASVVFSEECQINHILNLIAPILKRQVTSVDVDRPAHERYNKDIQKRVSGIVWTDCKSYYRAQSGKNTVSWPGPVALYWLWTRSPKWRDYIVRGADGRQRKGFSWSRKGSGILGWILKVALTAFVFVLIKAGPAKVKQAFLKIISGQPPSQIFACK